MNTAPFLLTINTPQYPASADEPVEPEKHPSRLFISLFWFTSSVLEPFSCISSSRYKPLYSLYVFEAASAAPSFAMSSALKSVPLPSMLLISCVMPSSISLAFISLTAASCPHEQASASAVVASPAVIITAALIASSAFKLSPALRNAVAPPTFAASGLTVIWVSPLIFPLSIHSAA